MKARTDMKLPDMDEIGICKHCGEKELYGNLTWKDGRQMCRKCYEKHIKEDGG